MDLKHAMTVMQHSRVFGSLEPSQLDTLVFLSYEKLFAQGETIYFKGQASDDKFGLIITGAVHVLKKDGSVFKRLQPGDVIGEIALSDPNQKRTMTVVAANPTEILEWEATHVKKETPDIWKKLVKLAWEHMSEFYEDIE